MHQFRHRAARLAAVLLLLCLGAGLGAPAARATPIATVPVRIFASFAHEFSGNIINDSIIYSVWVDPASDPVPEIGEGFLLAQFILTNGDLGKTLVASALNVPTFNQAAALLTNMSLNDFVSEAAFFFPDGGGGGDGGPEGPLLDLRGFVLGSVKLVVEQLSIVSPGQDLNNDGIWTDALFNGTLVFDTDVPVAEVPEPGTIGLMLAGLGALAVARRRRRR